MNLKAFLKVHHVLTTVVSFIIHVPTLSKAFNVLLFNPHHLHVPLPPTVTTVGSMSMCHHHHHHNGYSSSRKRYHYFNNMIIGSNLGYRSTLRRSLSSRLNNGKNDENDNEDGSQNNTSSSNEPIFYNDFEDFEFGPTMSNDGDSTSSTNNNDHPSSTTSPTNIKSPLSSSSSSSISEIMNNEKLSSLLTQSKQKEMEKDERIERNWSTGNWKVRGFSLAQYDYNGGNDDNKNNNDDRESDSNSFGSSSSSGGRSAIHVCQIAFDETMLGFNDVTETIAVGRTDGSIYIIQLGSDYMTNFASVSNNNGGMELQYKEEDDDDVIENVPSSLLSSSSSSFSPFQILHQFYTDDKKQPIESLLYHDELLYTSSGTSGEIKVWSIDDETTATTTNDTATSAGIMTSMIPIQTLSNGHSDKVVVMKTLSTLSSSNSKTTVNDHNLLLTASLDGSFALWSRDDGDLVYRCEMTDEDGNPVSVTCADVDTSSKEHFIYLGLSSGHIVGYAISDLIGSASSGNECPVPSCRFMAHDPTQQKIEDLSSLSSSYDNNIIRGVSAIACIGKGNSGSTSMSNIAQSSSLILAGGADGIIKQYEILRREQLTMNNSSTLSSQDQVASAPSWKLEHWPRLPSQRMKNHAHIFQGHYHSVSALASLNGSKIISASIDGTLRIWDQSKGSELYRMDGFDNKISSLCLDREVLVTNGMNGYVCVHDFDVTDSDVGDAFDLDLEW